MHFHAPRLIALRGGDRNEETPATENEREMLMRRACARTLSSCSFLLLLGAAGCALGVVEINQELGL